MRIRALAALALLLTTIPGMFGAAAHVAAQGDTGLHGNSYVDPVYGFTVEWDAAVFEAEEISGDNGDPYGVYLTSEGITGSVAAAGYADSAECLDDRVSRMEEADGVSRLRESRTAEVPELARDVTGAVYQYTFDNPQTGDSGRFATYFGCEPLLIDGEPQSDVVMSYDFGADLTAFNDLSAEWAPIIDSVTFSGEATNSGSNLPAEGGLSGNSYIDPVYHFSITWDGDAYDAEELELDDGVPYGVSLSSDTMLGSVYSDQYDSPRACLNGVADIVAGQDHVSEFDAADDLDLPETVRGARAGIYRYTYTSSSGKDTLFAQYIECRPIVASNLDVDGVFLAINFTTPEELWADSIPAVEDILGAIEMDVSLDSGNATPSDDTNGANTTPGVSGDRYLDPTNGWALTWNDAALTGENWVPGDSGDIQGVQLVAESGGFMTIYVDEFTSIRRCLTGQVDALEGDAFHDFAEVEDQDLPETGDDARAGLYQGIFTASSGQDNAIYLYAECRPLIMNGQEVDGQFLVVNLITNTDAFAGDLQDWSDVLTSVEFDAATQSGNNESNNTGDNSGASGIEGNTYTSNIGFRVSWDAADYAGELTDESNPDVGLSLSSDGSFITFSVAGDPSAADCVTAEVGVVEGLDGMSQLSRSREDSPNAGPDSASELYEGTLTFSSGTASDVVIYVECRPMAEAQGTQFFLVIRMVGIKESYADELPGWQDILDSIEFFDPGT